MTYIKFNQDNIVIEGHANFKEAGSDIVCATISTARHFLISLLELEYTHEDAKTIIKLPHESQCQWGLHKETIETFTDIVTQLSQQYPQNVKII